MIKFENVSKTYANGTKALTNVSLEIKKGSVVGILGPNGSGKTTFLKLIQGYLKPTSGNITINGLEIGAESKKLVSYLPDVPFMSKDFSIEKAKKLWAGFFDDFNEIKFDELINFLKLDKSMRIRDLSKGMSEKFHLSLVLSRDAEYYVIDEPIAGVDLVSREKIMEAIFGKISKDKTLIITTHLIDEMESLLDEVVFISKGEIVLTGNAEEIREEKDMQISEIFKEIYENEVY